MTRQRVRAAGLGLEHLYLVIALVWGIVQVFIVPPLQVPDEGDHFFRAWAVSEGQLFADRSGRVNVPDDLEAAATLYRSLVGDMNALPLSLEGEPGFRGYEQLFAVTPEPGRFDVLSRVSSYGPTGYLPPAAGIAIGRLAGLSPLDSFHLARLVNLVVAVALVFMAIRIAPFGKQLFLLMGLLPMTMYEFASAALDATTIAGAIFFVGLVLWARSRDRLRLVEAATLVVAAGVLLNIKPGYWALILLFLLLRPSQVGGRRRFAAFGVATVLVVGAIALGFFLATRTTGVGVGTGGPIAQLQFILFQPLAFAGVLMNNIQRNGLVWFLEGIGALGWLNVRLPVAMYLFVIVVGIGFVLRMEERVDLSRRDRAVLVSVGVAVFLTMAVALYAFLEPVGSGRVYFQGRYLAPVFLVLLLSVYGIRFAPRRVGVVFVAGTMLVVMLETIRTLASTYYG